MNITVTETPIEGVVVVDTEYSRDKRGYFIEYYHEQRFRDGGFVCDFAHDNQSRSAAMALRGIHFQDHTAPMGKLVRCVAGSIFDVTVDLRIGSPTFGKWLGFELSVENMRQILIPQGCGHGFAALSDFAEVHYKCTGYYTPSAEGTLAWDDPELGINWPIKEPIMSQRDSTGMSLQHYRSAPAFFRGDAERAS